MIKDFLLRQGARFLSGGTQGGILSGVPAMEEPLSRFFVQATIILAICRVLSLVGGYLGQPRVIFEIIGGILLGPSAIGRNANYLEEIFPHSSLGYLSIVANIGLTFYLFLVGLELDPKLLATHARKAGGIAIIGMAVPFALGIAISRVMFDVLQGNDPAYKDVSFVSFFVFIGTAMSITAFPVLARILKEGGLIYTKAGAMTMGAAALNDAVAWCLLTLAISIANAGNMAIAGYVFLTVAAFAFGLIFIVRPIFEYIVEYVEKMHNPTMNNNLFAFTICILFMCAWTTALLGVHAIFGAFLFGLIVPRGSHLFKECNERIEEFVVTVTLPLYFALSGLKTDVTTIHTSDEGAITVLVCVVASIGKFIGAGGTAYFAGMTVRESSVVAVLMNTRGLIELIVLNLGMESGILSTRTFSVMVVMCLFTTFLTCPLVELIYPKAMRVRGLEEETEDAEKKRIAAIGGGDGRSSQDDTAQLTASEVNPEDAIHVITETMTEFSIHAHVGIVIDKLTQMQSLLKLLVYLLPNAINSELGVTAVHTIEPTNSKKDEFLPLNEDGKLIRIDEETTDFATALHDMEDPAAQKPELLPLSMFCRAVNTPVNAFRVQGDPNEFPVVMKNIYKANDCSLVVVPWRPGSFYAEQLFWSTVQASHVPVALFVSIDQHLSYQHHHPGSHHPTMSASHHNSNAAEIFESAGSGRERDASSGSGGGSDRSPAVRRRGNSVYHKPDALPEYVPTATSEMEDDEEGGALFSTVPSTIVAQHRRASITNQMKKLGSKKKTSSTILAILTGRHMDIKVLSILLRNAENTMNEIYVMIPQDYDTFSSCCDALQCFKKHIHGKSYVKLFDLTAISSDYQELVRESLSTLSSNASHVYFDLFISAFIEPTPNLFSIGGNGGLTPTSGTSVPTPVGRAHRSASLSEALVGSLMGIGTSDANDDLATHSATPAKYANSGLTYPELGVLANEMLFYSENEDGTHPQFIKSSLMMILHESDKLLQRGAIIDSQSMKAHSNQPSQRQPFSGTLAVVPEGDDEPTVADVGSEEVGIEMQDQETKVQPQE